MATKPFIPGVEGSRYETYFQNIGMELPGQDIPERKRNGIDVKTNINMLVSRLRIKCPRVIAK